MTNGYYKDTEELLSILNGEISQNQTLKHISVQQASLPHTQTHATATCQVARCHSARFWRAEGDAAWQPAKCHFTAETMRRIKPAMKTPSSTSLYNQESIPTIDKHTDAHIKHTQH